MWTKNLFIQRERETTQHVTRSSKHIFMRSFHLSKRWLRPKSRGKTFFFKIKRNDVNKEKMRTNLTQERCCLYCVVLTWTKYPRPNTHNFLDSRGKKGGITGRLQYGNRIDERPTSSSSLFWRIFLFGSPFQWEMTKTRSSLGYSQVPKITFRGKTSSRT